MIAGLPPRFLVRLIMLALILTAAASVALAGEIPVPSQRPDPDTPSPARETAQPDLPVIHRSACPALRAADIKVEAAPPLREGQCGTDSPLTLESAAGVAFTGKPLVTCEMAGELAQIAKIAKAKASDLLNSGLAAIITGPGYECRRRNRAATGKLSEHAFANALDIAGFRLADGRQVMIGTDWPGAKPVDESRTEEEGSSTNDAPTVTALEARATTPNQKFLAEVHAAACQRFTTVLSPDSNTAHESHLHFDLGCHGRDCRYLICE